MTKDPTAGWLPPLSRRQRLIATVFAFVFLAVFLAIRTHLVHPFAGR
jgi:hypothetical protein